MRYKVTLNEKHELTLSFNSSDELWSFAKKYQDKIVSVSDYKIYTCGNEPQSEQVEVESEDAWNFTIEDLGYIKIG